MEIFERIEALKVLPVAVIDDSRDALPLATALARGGLTAIEVTFRTNAAAEAIRIIRSEQPDILVGAGTVLTKEQVHAAADAGAQFLVAPGLNPAIVGEASEVGLTMIPGILTPSEVEQALSMGITRVKFFPAEAGGGTAMLKAMSAPYRMMRFMPTGGVTPNNLSGYLALDCVYACGLSSVCERRLISAGNYAEIERRAADIVDIVERGVK